MKTTLQLFALGCLLTLSVLSKAQGNSSSRPDLFNSFPATIQASSSELEKAFYANVGNSLQLNFANGFSFNGTVLSSLQKYKNLYTVIAKSTVLKNALLSISKITNNDNSIIYVGRIINEKYADGYQLVKDKTGNYYFNKIKTEDLIQDF